MGNITKTQNIYTLVNPVWIRNAGLGKGLDHDRQHLGIILGAGQTLRIRQLDADFTSNLTLRLLNNSRHTETSASVGKDWLAITVDYASVPFIDTPYAAGTPRVEFEYAPDNKRLPVFLSGDPESAFFLSWDTQAAEFGLLESGYMRMLAPAADKETLRNYVGGLAAVCDYYDGVVSMYNAMVGVSSSPDHLTDVDVRNKFFIKADANSHSTAYYGNNWTAANDYTVTGFWLTKLRTAWGPLHEIGHGYQGTFMSSGSVSFSEVWNNIYAQNYQQVTLGPDVYKEGAVFSTLAERSAVFMNYIAQGTPFNSWNGASKELFMFMSKDKAGDSAFTFFNQQFRILANEVPQLPSPPVLDILSAAYASKGDVDITPFAHLANAPISAPQADLNMFSNARAVYPVYQLVSSENLTKVREQLHLDTPIRLVDSIELKGTGLTGTVNLHFDIDDFKQIYAQSLVLMEGPRKALTLRIDAQDMVLEDFPIGVYTLHPPTGFDVKYQPGSHYLVVSEGTHDVTVSYQRKVASTLVSQIFYFHGLSDWRIGTLALDADRRMAQVDLAARPHSYFPNETYYSIDIRDASGTTVFFKDVKGDQADPFTAEVPYDVGYRIVIYHAEVVSRLITSPPSPGLIDTAKKTNEFVVTEMGLANPATAYDPAVSLQARIAAEVEVNREHLTVVAAPFAPQKDDVYLAANVLPEPQRTIVMTEYADMMPRLNDMPGTNVGNSFAISMIGYGPAFFSCQIDRVAREITFETLTRKPHALRTGTYAYVSFCDIHGDELFAYDFVADVVPTPMVRKFPLSALGGEQYYSWFMREALTNYPVVNNMQGVTLYGNLRETAIPMLENGIDILPAESQISITPDVQANFLQWDLLGELDHEVARLHIDLTRNTLSITIWPVVPADYVTGVFIGIHVEDKYGQTVFDVNLKGNVRATAVTETFALQKGYAVTVKHLEPGRSILVNTETNVQTTVGTTASYQTMARGLKAI